MKSYLTRLFTIIVSGLIISSTVFLTSSGGIETRALAVEEQSIAKGDVCTPQDGAPIRSVNINSVFRKYTAKGNLHDDEDDEPTVPDMTGSSTTTSVTSAGTDSSPSSSAAKTTATTAPVVIPTDESGNIEYIKDPDYKSPYYIVVYTGSQSAVVYGKDKNGTYSVQLKSFTVSTGRTNSPTRKGVYRIRAKYRWRTLMGPCYGQYCSSISPDYLFHSVPYDQRRPDTLYNASYNNLGRAVSHGCIRMCVRDVKWIYDNCPIGTQVHVVWTSGPKGAGVPKRKSGSKYRGWDPSDQWAEGNPYFKDTETTESDAPTTGKTEKSTQSTKQVSSATESTKTTVSSETSKTTQVKTTSESTTKSTKAVTSDTVASGTTTASSATSKEKTEKPTSKPTSKSTSKATSKPENTSSAESEEEVAVG